MRPEHITELAPVFDAIRRSAAVHPRGTLFEIILPLESLAGVSKAGGHVVRHLDVPQAMVGIVI